MRRHNIIVTREDGVVEIYPMKEWLRQNPGHLPPGVDVTSTDSSALKNILKRLGWSVQETPEEVRLIKPGNVSQESSIEAVLGDDGAETEEDGGEPPSASFALEYQLRDFIAQNLSTIPIEGRKLHLYVDPTGREGIEFSTPVGLIDILAMDDSGALIVFELKRARSPDHAIGQLARYMGWVKQTIGKDREVHGVIVARTIGERLKYAVSVIPNVRLFEYEVEFRLKLVPQMLPLETSPEL